MKRKGVWMIVMICFVWFSSFSPTVSFGMLFKEDIQLNNFTVRSFSMLVLSAATDDVVIWYWCYHGENWMHYKLMQSNLYEPNCELFIYLFLQKHFTAASVVLFQMNMQTAKQTNRADRPMRCPAEFPWRLVKSTFARTFFFFLPSPLDLHCKQWSSRLWGWLTPQPDRGGSFSLSLQMLFWIHFALQRESCMHQQVWFFQRLKIKVNGIMKQLSFTLIGIAT